MNPLIKLKEFGQSVWYDNIRRSLITSGELKRMIHDYGLSGMTSNPVIFEKAISGGEEYDANIERLASEGRGPGEILTELTTKDIAMAADELYPVYKETGGRDGYVSIEVSPGLARDADGSVREARHLRNIIDRPNVMVKIPGTKEGLGAIEELLYQGFNINVTLLFSVKRYEEVAWAYVRALERRADEGKDVEGIFSVASFFVSRVDTLVDMLIEERVERSESKDEKARLRALLGKTAVANAKAAYSIRDRIFASDRFIALAGKGAGEQKLLWASTSTKNPSYSDIKYVEELIAPETINTMPLQTLHAFEDHGRVAPTLEEGLDEAEEVLSELDDLGFDYDELTARLEDEGIAGFEKGFDSLLSGLEEKVSSIGHAPAAAFEMALGEYADTVEEVTRRFDSEKFVERLWEKDPTLWKKDHTSGTLIKNALGWLALPRTMPANVESIERFAAEVRGAVYDDAVLLGMGGSSLAPLVLAETFGAKKGCPRLTVLDTTDPDAVAEITGRIDPAKTLFIVSSKSGSTIEPLSLFEHFHALVRERLGDDAGRNFVAITDPDTPLEGFSRKFAFRHLFINPGDIGGRFSALSYFGLVPAAIAGVDIARLLDSAERVEEAAQPCVDASADPAVRLGAAIGALGRRGRDKLTFFLSPELETFGLWIEQLIAESTGKEGTGLVPVTGEPLGALADYGADRVFISISLGAPAPAVERRLAELAGAGHPVIRLRLKDLHELGGEFLRWELATAAAGEVLGINPFDQPDVELAKRLTMSLLDRSGESAGPPEMPGRVLGADGCRLVVAARAAALLKDSAGLRDGDAASLLRDFFGLVGKGCYVGLLAYVNPFDASLATSFAEIRRVVRDATGAPVQFGYGPRYLHSTGQLHKGGAGNGAFIVITHSGKDVPVPGSRFGFSTLELSQAFGDVEALDSRGRAVVVFHLDEASEAALAAVEGMIKNALEKVRLQG